MYCTQCGTMNDDRSTQCSYCKAILFVPGRSDTGQAYPARIPNYLVQSVLVTLCCCLPVGIVAIVYAAQVNVHVRAGDLEGARRCSRRAFLWGWVAFGLGVLFALAYLALVLLGRVAS